MEYRVLSRKWRPQLFENVIGQDHVVQTLTNAIRQKRIAHAFIFSGPRGVGKTSIARIFAKALNCETGPTEAPCNVCANCREITEGISIDVHEIDGASNRGIDEIRELRENVKFSPVSSRYKVYIIDEVHMLTREAFNALLKTLEEPPGHVIFIFATTETHKVPTTILSRCQCFDFRRMSLKQNVDNLRGICESEGITISDAGLMWIAEAADGSARDAQSILDQVISYAGQQIEDGDIQDLLGLTDRRFLNRFSEAVIEGDAAQCLRIVEEAYYAGVDMKFFYQMLLGHFRNLLLLKILGDHHSLLDLTGDELMVMKNQIKISSRETLQQHLDILMAEEEAVRKSPNPRLNLEAILVRMAYLDPIIPIDRIMARIEGIERRLSSGVPASPGTFKAAVAELTDRLYGTDSEALDGMEDYSSDLPANAVDEPAANPVYDDQRIDEPAEFNPETFRNDFLQFARVKNLRLTAKIEPGKLSYEDGCLTISVPAGYIFLEDIKQADQRERLAELAKAFFGKEVAVKIETLGDEDDGGGSRQKNGNHKSSDIKREALQGPMLQKVLDVFSDAEVREVLHRKNRQNNN